MQITQPELENAVQQMEQLRNQATIYEQEALRFRKLVVAEEYTVGQLLAQKADLNKEILELQEKKKVAEIQLSEVLKHKYEVEEVVFAKEDIARSREEALVKKEEDAKKREEAIVEKESLLERTQKALNEAVIEVDAIKAKLSADKVILKEALDKLV